MDTVARTRVDPNRSYREDALVALIAELRAALSHIVLECEATHTGQDRAYTALSRIDALARGGLR